MIDPKRFILIYHKRHRSGNSTWTLFHVVDRVTGEIIDSHHIDDGRGPYHETAEERANLSTRQPGRRRAVAPGVM